MGFFKNKSGNTPFMSEIHQRTLHKNLEFSATEQYRYFSLRQLRARRNWKKASVYGIQGGDCKIAVKKRL
jgi:hypothetical protein